MNFLYYLLIIFSSFSNNHKTVEYKHVKGYDITIVVDYSIHSGKNRMFVLNNKDSVLFETLVAHGIKSGVGAYATKFSNVTGSNKSSLGLASVGKKDYSNYGLNFKYWLHGLDQTNSNLKQRVIVIHSHESIPNEEIYPKEIVNSEGCYTISNQSLLRLEKLIENKKTILNTINGL